MPLGMDKWFPVLGTALPGMETMMSSMMKQKTKPKGVASIEKLRNACIESDVTLIGKLRHQSSVHMAASRCDNALPESSTLRTASAAPETDS